MSRTVDILGVLTEIADDDPRGPPLTSLAQARTDKIADLTAACDAKVNGGYVSAALGSAHTYPSTDDDRSNMQASIIASLLPGNPADWTTLFLCAAVGAAPALVPHTATQIQQAGQDGKSFILGLKIRLAQLSGQVMQAATVQAVQAISW